MKTRLQDDFSIRPAAGTDLARIAEIQASAPEAAHWKPADYLSQTCSVALVRGVVAGFLVTRDTAPGETEILNVAVDPTYRRQGIGRRFIEHLLQHVRQNPEQTQVFLEVRESNAAARRLYERSGFRVVGRRQGYYHEPREDGIVMQFFS